MALCPWSLWDLRIKSRPNPREVRTKAGGSEKGAGDSGGGEHESEDGGDSGGGEQEFEGGD